MTYFELLDSVPKVPETAAIKAIDEHFNSADLTAESFPSVEKCLDSVIDAICDTITQKSLAVGLISAVSNDDVKKWVLSRIVKSDKVQHPFVTAFLKNKKVQEKLSSFILSYMLR